MAFSYLQDREMDISLRGTGSFWPDDLTLFGLCLGFRLGEYKLSENKCIHSVLQVWLGGRDVSPGICITCRQTSAWPYSLIPAPKSS